MIDNQKMIFADKLMNAGKRLMDASAEIMKAEEFTETDFETVTIDLDTKDLVFGAKVHL